MNKRKFLEELEKHLMILDESERQDILNEYKDIIAEKVKHGKTEEEAIEDFGSIDELSKEILKAYKVNPDYLKKKQSTSGDKAKEIINNSEDLIKEGARKLSEFTSNIINDIKNSNNITTEVIFEIIIKAILILIGFAILRVPFWIIEGLGSDILRMSFYPFNKVLIFIWSIVISVLYFITCVIIGILVFRQYFNYNNNKKNGKPTKKKSNVTEIKEADNKEEKKVSHVKKTNDNSVSSVISIIVKVFLIICFLIPLFFTNLGLIFALVILGYLLFKGLNVIGIIIILVGLITIFGCLQSFITNALYNRIKFSFAGFVVGVVFFITGCLFVIDHAITLDYHNVLPPGSFEMKTTVYNEHIDNEVYVLVDNKLEKNIDNTLEDGNIKIEVTYYDDFVYVVKSFFEGRKDSRLYIDTRFRGRSIKTLLNVIVDDLKDDKIYNYGHFYKSEVKISANENTMNLIKG